jgi:hypothetical protein
MPHRSIRATRIAKLVDSERKSLSAQLGHLNILIGSTRSKADQLSRRSRFVGPVVERVAIREL